MMMRDMDINVAINSEVTKCFTRYCKRNGYASIVVLKYIIENRNILDRLCVSIFQQEEKYLKAIKYQNSMKAKPKGSTTKFKLKGVTSNTTLKDILEEYNITIVFFFCYLAANESAVNLICNNIPDELKLKKYQ